MTFRIHIFEKHFITNILTLVNNLFEAIEMLRIFVISQFNQSNKFPNVIPQTISVNDMLLLWKYYGWKKLCLT